jgi:hypothetical protein
MPSRSDRAFAPAADPDGWRASALHDPARDWPQTNCYVDLWIEALHARGFAPEAMLAFTTRLDFEGDQFTFFKPPLEDVEALYGLATHELALYDDMPEQFAQQCARGRMVMVETDAFFLPDTRGVSYAIEQSKTTIGINRIDIAARRLDYFHNDGFFRAEGEDFDGLMAFGATSGRQKLPPYAEIVKPDYPALEGRALKDAARALLGHHLRRRPKDNPVAAFAERLPALVERVGAREPEFFHKFAFNTLRQLGANFELLGAFLDWLGEPNEFARETERCKAISEGAKSFQFLLARAVVRKKTVGLDEPMAKLADAYDALFAQMTARQGAVRLAS